MEGRGGPLCAGTAAGIPGRENPTTGGCAGVAGSDVAEEGVPASKGSPIGVDR